MEDLKEILDNSEEKKVLFDYLILNDVYLEALVFNDKDSYIIVKSLNLKIWKINFKVFLAFRIICKDFINYDVLDDYYLHNGFNKRLILVVESSNWIKELQQNNIESDPRADFIRKAKHYIFPLCDKFIEIIAWDLDLIEM